MLEEHITEHRVLGAFVVREADESNGRVRSWDHKTVLE